MKAGNGDELWQTVMKDKETYKDTQNSPPPLPILSALRPSIRNICKSASSFVLIDLQPVRVIIYLLRRGRETITSTDCEL